MTLAAWILILVTGTAPGSPMVSAEFDTREACEWAIHQAAEKYRMGSYAGSAGAIMRLSVCVPKE